MAKRGRPSRLEKAKCIGITLHEPIVVFYEETEDGFMVLDARGNHDLTITEILEQQLRWLYPKGRLENDGVFIS